MTKNQILGKLKTNLSDNERNRILRIYNSIWWNEEYNILYKKYYNPKNPKTLISTKIK